MTAYGFRCTRCSHEWFSQGARKQMIIDCGDRGLQLRVNDPDFESKYGGTWHFTSRREQMAGKEDSLQPKVHEYLEKLDQLT